MTHEFDPYKYASELLSTMPRSGTRLSFTERCALYAGFQIGFKAPVLARAFGVRRQTANYIAGCNLPGGRYPDVAAEFEALGDQVFVRRYFTEDIATRVERVKHEVMRFADDRSVKGPDYRATSKASRLVGVIHLNNNHWRIDWTEGKGHPDGEGGPGWRFTHCNEDGSLPEGHFYQGREALGGNPFGETPPSAFRTSGLAYKALITAY